MKILILGEVMNYYYRRLICSFLCLCLVIQPFVFNAAFAQTRKVFEGGQSKESIFQQLNDSAAGVSGVQGSDIPSSQANDDASDSEKATAASANQNASDQMGRIRNAPGDITSAANEAAAVTTLKNNNSVGDLTSTTSKIQATLFKIGNTLVKIGSTLKSVGQALQAVGAILKAIPWTHAAGVALENVGKLLYRIGTVVENIGNIIIKTAQVASNADDIFGTILGDIPNAVKDGWKKGGEEADAYSEQLNSKLSKNNPAASQENSSTETQDSESETTSDADQGDIADI